MAAGTITIAELVALGRVQPDEEWEQLAGARGGSEPLARVCVIEDGFEADLLRGALLAEGIPCLVENYREIALDGLFQLTRGWGALIVPLPHFERARDLIAEVRPGLREALPPGTPE
jgi:hypothetical protein